MADVKVKIDAIANFFILVRFLFITFYNITSSCALIILLFIYNYTLILLVNCWSFIFVNFLNTFPNSTWWFGWLRSILVRSHCSQRAHILVFIFITWARSQWFLQLISSCRRSTLCTSIAALYALLATSILIAQRWFLLSGWSRLPLLWFGSTIWSVGCGCESWVCVLFIESCDKRRSCHTLFWHEFLWSCWTSVIGRTAILFTLKHF